MILAKVVGQIWSTRKEEALRGIKFLVVQPINLTFGSDGTVKEVLNFGNNIIAGDRIGAGEGDFVMVVSGSSARQLEGDSHLPIDANIVGIVDSEMFER
ncbi:MAG TPA: EutN/CcmL family microcompartment protein [Anaerovoracaceae bacterium]|nr:EutN/CcmL family microcompartment protein [Anaerovoracaceae bacterium]